MHITPAQTALAIFELCLVLAGGLFVLQLLLIPENRVRWLRTNQLAPWPVPVPEFVLFLVLLGLSGMLFQGVMHILLRSAIAASHDREGLQVFVYGAGFDSGALLGLLLFPFLQKAWAPDPAAIPPFLPRTSLPWSKVARYAGATLLAAMPVIILLSLGWIQLVRLFGLPAEPQPLIAVFTNTRSPFVLIGMFLVACVLGPLFEEVVFRAGLYRFCRQHFGRGWALVISGLLFGGLHANWAGLVPLATLGAIFALAYEATGDIRVPVLAHSLFNLNAVLLALSGLPQTNP